MKTDTLMKNLRRWTIAGWVMSGILTAQTYQNGKIHLIENEFSGQILGQYASDAPQLGPRIIGNDKEITLFSKTEKGTTYYSFASPYGMQDNDPNKYLRFGSPVRAGEPLQRTKDAHLYWWEAIPYVTADGRHYDYVYLKNQHTGLYMKDTADTRNSLSLRAPTRTGNTPAIVTATTLDDPHDRRFLWQITPTTTTPPSLNLALPQSGWSPHANKIAVLSSKTRLASPHYSLKKQDGTILYEADGLSYGQYWDGLYFYTLNLNVPALTHEGEYRLEVAGITKPLFIKKDLYLHPLRMEGKDALFIDEIFDPNVGFVTQWGRLENWWPNAYDFLASQRYWDPWSGKVPNTFPKWIWRDDTDANGNGIEIEPFDGTSISQSDAKQIYHGAWEMTDQYAHNYAYDGLVLYRLTQMHELANTDSLKAKIYREILYGVDGMLKRQESDGGWRQGYMDRLKWTGTTAGLGAALAAAYPIVAAQDAALASQIKDAVDAAWGYVSNKVEDETSWAVANKGVTPDGSTLKATPPSQRNLWRESYLLFASTLYRTTKAQQYKAILEQEIPSAIIAYNGWFGSPTSLVGQHTAHGDWALTALLDYYPDASDDVKKHIEKIAEYYYTEYLIKSDLVGGPFGAYGKRLTGYAAAYTWEVWKKMLSALQLYHTFGKRYAQGVRLAQQAMNWYWGANPYSSSLVFGVGDFYVNGGWASYHTIGRHTSLESQGMHLMGSDGTFYSSETTVLGSLTLWYTAMLLDAVAYSSDGVACYVNGDYKGANVMLNGGTYDQERLAALGIDMASIKSLKLPQGYEVRLHHGSDTITVNSDTAQLTLPNDISSIEVRYHGASAPVALKPSVISSPPEHPEENIPQKEKEPQTQTPSKPQTPQTQKPTQSDQTNTRQTKVESSGAGIAGWLLLLFGSISVWFVRRVD